jgi:hypothetical protein
MTSIKSLTPGDSLAGIMIDGVEGTPYVVGNLLFNEGRGIRVEVPYFEYVSTGQFDSAKKWFSEQVPPKNVLFVSNDGVLTLFDCRFSGYSAKPGLGIALGKIAPAEVVLKQREGDLGDPLTVKTIRSHFDGLAEWTNFSSIKDERVVDKSNLVKKVVVEIETTQSITWWQGAAKMTLSIDWSAKSPGGGYLVDEVVYLESTFRDPRPISAHLNEHRKVKTLVALVHGVMVYYRKHFVRDKRFPERAMSGKLRHFSFCELISQDTVQEYRRAKPDSKMLGEPLASAIEVGGPALRDWAERFEDWERFIYPALSSMNAKEVGLENSVVNASMAIEAAGNIIGPASGERETYSGANRPTTATFAFRCLSKTGVSCVGMANSRIGLAKAMANNYNTIKHYDRGQFPKPEETFLVQKVATLVVRLLALDLAGVDAEQSHFSFRKEREFSNARSSFNAFGLFVDRAGKFVARGQVSLLKP